MRIIWVLVVVALASCGSVNDTKKDAAIDTPQGTKCVLDTAKLDGCTL